MSTNFRAGVMLTVLVGLPAAWVYYGPLPPSAQHVVDHCLTEAKEAIQWEKFDGSRLMQLKWPWAAGQFTAEPAVTPTSLASPSAPSPGTPVAAAPPRFVPSLPAPVSTPTPAPTPAPVAQGMTPLEDQLEPLLGQLRSWRAAEYALTRWGGDELFRFRCDMPLADGSPSAATQQFDAIAESPRAAVEQVVSQIAAWRTFRETAASAPAPKFASN